MSSLAFQFKPDSQTNIWTQLDQTLANDRQGWADHHSWGLALQTQPVDKQSDSPFSSSDPPGAWNQPGGQLGLRQCIQRTVEM